MKITTTTAATVHMTFAFTGLMGFATTGNSGFLGFGAVGLVLSNIFFTTITFRAHARMNIFHMLMGVALISLGMISSLYNDAHTPENMAALTHIGLISLLLPNISQLGIRNGSERRLCRVLIGIALLTLMIATAWKVGGLGNSYRFGGPLSPGIFGFYMVIAALTSYYLRGFGLLFLLFAGAAVFSESRSAVLGLIIGIVIMQGLSPRRTIGLCVLALMGGGGILRAPKRMGSGIPAIPRRHILWPVPHMVIGRE